MASTQYEHKLARAIAELDAAKIWKSNSRPPYYLLFRRMGMKVRPPHYEPLWRLFLSHTIMFNVLCLLGLGLFQLVVPAFTFPITAGDILTLGLLFGLGMLVYQWWSRTVHHLTQWDKL